MKLGLVAYSDNTGLGSQTKAYYDNLMPFRTMVLDRTNLITPHKYVPGRFPDVWRTIPGLPDIHEVHAFLSGLDVVLMAETAPTQYMIRAARARGVRTVVVPNWEYFDKSVDRRVMPDMLMPASLWHYDDYPGTVYYVPFAVTPRQIHRVRPTAKRFLHIAGRPVYPDRNGTELLFESLQHVTEPITVTLTCLDPKYLDDLARKYQDKLPGFVEIKLLGPQADLSELYLNNDALLMPRRFGGLCLPVNEAIGYGLPVIMPDIMPNSSWLPMSWLVTAHKTDTRKMANPIDVYSADPRLYAARIDRLAGDDKFYARCLVQASELAYDYSWQTLKPKYLDVLENMVTLALRD